MAQRGRRIELAICPCNHKGGRFLFKTEISTHFGKVERLRPPFWLPTPHYTTDDFVYKGMFIPKDTVVMYNCWTMHHNEERYPDPRVFSFQALNHTKLSCSFYFNPERYLGDRLSCADSSRLLNSNQRDHWAFGAG